MSHTKGPWTTTGHYVYGPDDTEIAEFHAADNSPVIAAAPELLEALKAIGSCLAVMGIVLPIAETMLASNAISKAEGK